jgi:hypothetical protein
LSAVRDCLFHIFAASLHIGGRSSIPDLRTRHAVVTGETELQAEKPESSFVHHKTQYKLDCDRPPASAVTSHEPWRKDGDALFRYSVYRPTAPCVTVLYQSGISSHGSLDDHLTGSDSIMTSESRTN